METLSVVILPVVIFFTFFASLWLFVCFILARVGGWEKLARVYRYDGKFSGERWRFRSCKMNGYTNYNNCLTFGVNPEGLYMKILPLFRFHHPPLLIPWSDIKEEKVKGIIFSYRELTFTVVPNIRVRIISSLAEELLRGGRKQKSGAFISPAYKKIEPH
jgi:hypothetical protein